jgi:hypothetical protein
MQPFHAALCVQVADSAYQPHLHIALVQMRQQSLCVHSSISSRSAALLTSAC